MMNNFEKEIESIDNAIKNLSGILEEKSKRAQVAWARNDMRAITMDLQELFKIRKMLIKNNDK